MPTPHDDFQRLVLVHLDAGYNLARWLTRDPHDAEDVVQEACLRAMHYIGGLRAEDGRAWFLSIVRRAFYDWLARNRPAWLLRDDEAGLALFGGLEGIADAADGPEQTLVKKRERLALADAVDALPLAFREVIVLRELEELSYKQIAQITDVPIGTVMSRLSRARQLLHGAALRQPDQADTSPTKRGQA